MIRKVLIHSVVRRNQQGEGILLLSAGTPSTLQGGGNGTWITNEDD